jgi:hypothetical protein
MRYLFKRDYIFLFPYSNIVVFTVFLKLRIRIRRFGIG